MEHDVRDRIREAIACEDYGTALREWNGYAARLGDDFRRGLVSAERMAEVREVFEWSRNTLLCARAHDLARLNAMRAAAAYTNISPGL